MSEKSSGLRRMTKLRRLCKNIPGFQELPLSIFIAKGYKEHSACEGTAFEEGVIATNRHSSVLRFLIAFAVAKRCATI
nr:hypothetical protein [Chitinophagaceae bacterium]